jgi:hypothetical protein
MNVTTLIFLGLAVVWAIVLLPEALRKFAGSRNGDSIRSFNHQLSVLDRSGGVRPSAATGARSNVIDFASRGRAVGPRPSVRVTPPSVRKRRQEVLTVLGAAAVLTLLGTVAFGGIFLAFHLLADLLLVAYLVALVQVNQQAEVRRAEPRPSHVAVRPATVGQPVARRIAN